MLAHGIEAAVKLDIGLITVPVAHPHALAWNDAEHFLAAGEREALGNELNALADATVADDGGDVPRA
jgi:hypothetical protein